MKRDNPIVTKQSLFISLFSCIYVIIKMVTVGVKPMKINNDIYKMYEEEVIKVDQANKKIKNLKLEIYILKSELAFNNKDNNENYTIDKLTNRVNKGIFGKIVK